MNDKETTIEEIKIKIKYFIDERDWEQFHNPKDVAIALTIEVAEILEHMRWKTKKELEEYLNKPKNKEEIGDELADTLMFLVDLARVCDIDLAEAFERKLKKVEKNYPKDLVRGKAHKYTHYQS